MRYFSNHIRITAIIWGVLALVLLLPSVGQAQTPVVYGVFFYSPTCPHCHEVIDKHWPGIEAEFGDQLQVLFIDASTPAGGQLMRTAIDAMRIPAHGVPMLIIGTDFWVGSVNIPERAPQTIRAGLTAGGIGYPLIPGIEAIFESVLPVVTSAAIEPRSLLDDPANIAALIVLGGLVASLGMMAFAAWKLVIQRRPQFIQVLNGGWGQRMALTGTLIGVVLAASLVIGSFEDPLTLAISSAVLAAFVLLAFHLARSPGVSQLTGRLIPLTLLAGLLVAGYLAYVETTLVEATCGVIGDCNAVQQSPYASLLGLPVGVIGIGGYLSMLILWLVNRVKPSAWIDALLFLGVVFSVGFSIYLTFLEPFVIGASCVWCLISAVVMGILLWLLAPAGWAAVHSFDQRQSVSA